jgi:hypothetical protein
LALTNLCFFGFPIYLTATRPDKPGEKKKNIFIRLLQIFGINYLTIAISGGVSLAVLMFIMFLILKIL